MNAPEWVSVEGLTVLFFKAAILILLAIYLADQFRHSPAAVRHRVWVGLLVALAAVPVWSLLGPELSVPLLPPEPGLPDSGWISALAYIYLFVVAVRLLGLLASITRVIWISLRSKRANIDWQQSLHSCRPARTVLLRASDAIDSPLTWGFLKPVILVPSSMDTCFAERSMILQHELEHIRRGDWLTQLLGQLVGILFWPVPGMARALRRLSLAAEQSCDDHVLQSTDNAATYAALLLKQARAQHLPTSVALGQPSELAQRVGNLCEPTIDHRTSPGLKWALLVAASLALPIAALQPAYQAAVTSEPQRAMGINLGRVKLTPGSEPATGISKPDRPLEVSRAPHLSYVMAEAELDIPTTDLPPLKALSGDSPSIEPISPQGAKLGWLETPLYPERARRRGIEGDVTVLYDLTEAGNVVNLRVLAARPEGVFEESIRNALAVADEDASKIVIRNLESVYRFRLRDSQARASPR